MHPRSPYDARMRRYSGCHMASRTCCTMSTNLTPARPSAYAASATATATVADTLRRSSTWGSSEAPGWRTVTRLDTALAAAANMPSLILAARDTIAPRLRPGYSMALFAWPTTYVTPLYVTGANGLPVATNARPPVHAIRSPGFASARGGG